MKCNNRNCYYNDKANVIKDNHFLYFIPCEKCNKVFYHQAKCKEEDWNKHHKNTCSHTFIDIDNKQDNNEKLRNRSTKRSLKDFEKVGSTEIGRGSYGYVCKVREILSNKIFAMKVMSKKFIFKYSCDENVKKEINIQKRLNHSNIIKLNFFFEDKQNVYLILDYAENGDLFQYLKKYKKFNEKEAFDIFFQACLGIDYLHKKGIIHRDLKPENLLFDSLGHVKLCDFGWSSDENIEQKATFCGTIDYMAPEIINKQKYDKRIDIWGLGILLYELLHGVTPFGGKGDTDKMKQIKQNKIKNLNPQLSSDVRNLIHKILEYDSNKRLSLKEIFNHNWFKRFEKENNINIQSFIYQDANIETPQSKNSRESRGFVSFGAPVKEPNLGYSLLKRPKNNSKKLSNEINFMSNKYINTKELKRKESSNNNIKKYNFSKKKKKKELNFFEKFWSNWGCNGLTR